jgi:hypothetical protein
MKSIERINSVFPFQDEPFHAGPEAFDYSDEAKAEFFKRYGYTMPPNLELVRNDPKNGSTCLTSSRAHFLTDGGRYTKL